MIQANSKIQLYPLVRIIVVFVVGIVIGESLKDVVPQDTWLAAVIIGLIIGLWRFHDMPCRTFCKERLSEK